jgi:hypothetical protein
MIIARNGDRVVAASTLAMPTKAKELVGNPGATPISCKPAPNNPPKLAPRNSVGELFPFGGD